MKTFILSCLVLLATTVSAQVKHVRTLNNELRLTGAYYTNLYRYSEEIFYLKADFTDSGTIKLPVKFDKNVNDIKLYLFSTKTFDEDPDFDFIIYTTTGVANRSDARIYHQDGTLAYDFRTIVSEYQFSVWYDSKFIYISGNGTPSSTYFFEPSGTIGHIIGATEKQLNIYPNPADNTLFINSQTGGTLQLFDFLGNIIRSEPFNDQTLDLSGLLPGEYVVKIIRNNEIISGRFIKM